jgi:hypothetical protein
MYLNWGILDGETALNVLRSYEDYIYIFNCGLVGWTSSTVLYKVVLYALR